MAESGADLARQGAGALARALRRQRDVGCDGWADTASIEEALSALEQTLADAPPAAAQASAPRGAQPATSTTNRASTTTAAQQPSAPADTPRDRDASPSADPMPPGERLPWMPSSPATGVVTAPGAEGLAQVLADLGDCRRCKLCNERTNIVFGTGDPNARLMFIGEAPGADEDVQGEPFVGKAGQLLTRMVEAMGYSREQVYIANVVKCRPPSNRDPEPDEIRECEPFLMRQIDAVRPEVIVTLGRFAFQALTRSRRSIMRSRGTWFEYRGVPAMPTLHPAYLIRTPSAKRDVWSDLQQVMSRLESGTER